MYSIIGRFFLTYPFFQFTGLCIHAICPLPCLFLSRIIVPHWPFEIPIFHLYSLGCFRLLREHWTYKHEFIVFALCAMFGRRIISIYISIGFSSNYVTGFFKHIYIYSWPQPFKKRQRLCSEFWMIFFIISKSNKTKEINLLPIIYLPCTRQQLLRPSGCFFYPFF